MGGREAGKEWQRLCQVRLLLCIRPIAALSIISYCVVSDPF